jgi:L-threonate 2-dehydrogenase
LATSSSFGTVGVIGAGAMGEGILRRLNSVGVKSLAFDIDSEKLENARSFGAGICISNAQLLSQADVSFVVVVDSLQIETVFTNALNQVKTGAFVVLCSTIAPASTQKFAEQIRNAGAFPIDAPISGGPARAAAGEMSMMIAAPSDHVAALMPLFKQISAKQFVISALPGDAAKAKLVNNLLAAINLAGAAEAMALAEKIGLNGQQIFELMSASSGQSWMMEDRVARALQNDYLPRAASHVLTKDVTLANEMAALENLVLPMGEAARTALKATCDQGWRLEDDAAVLKYYRAKFTSKLI